MSVTNNEILSLQKINPIFKTNYFRRSYMDMVITWQQTYILLISLSQHNT